MSHQKMSTRSTTHPDTIFQELPVKTNKKTTPPPTPPTTPSAPLKPMRLVHPDTILPISRNLFGNISFEREVPKVPRIFVPQKLDGFVLDPDSSGEWMKNKIKLEKGHYVITCGRPNPNSGRKCSCATHDGIGLYSGCAKHYMWEENLNKFLNF